MGSCINGIICLKYYVEHNQIHDFALWNPTIREFKVLPSLPIHFPSNVDYEDVGSAFGYDSNSTDFKVIQFSPIGTILATQSHITGTLT